MEKEVLKWYLTKEIEIVLSNGYRYNGKIIDVGENHSKFKDNKTNCVHVFVNRDILDIADKETIINGK